MPRRDTTAQRRRWMRARRAEIQFARQLRLVANKCGKLARETFDPDRPLGSTAKLRRELENYGQTLAPWARAVADKMVQDVARRDENFWYEQSKEMSRNLRREIKNAPTGVALRERMYESAALITSLPLEAAQRVEATAIEYTTRGLRAGEFAKRIMATGQVTKSRANTIARTETSRTLGILQEVRAKSVGSVGYIWRTAEDFDVRDLHEDLEGKFFTWDRPPIAGSRGERAHPGGIYNCFPGDTLVDPNDGQRRVLRAGYSGSLIVLDAGEAHLEVTPNHPILTPRGWVAAGELQLGDNICQMPLKRSQCFEDNINNRLVPIGKVFETFSANRETGPDGSVYRLYGDIAHNEVEVVRAKQNLSLRDDANFLHSVSEQMVANANSWVKGAGLERCFTKVLDAFQTGLLDIGDFLLFGSGRSQQLIGASAGPALDAFLFEELRNRPISGVERFSQSGDAFTSKIPRDNLRVVAISGRAVRDFFGHVYTFETETGFYTTTPARIIVRNCRCWAEVVLPGEPKRAAARRRFFAEAA